MSLKMDWLPIVENWGRSLEAIEEEGDPRTRWFMLARLAGHDLSLVQATKLDRLLKRYEPPEGWAAFSHRHIKLAVLGTGTLGHLAGPLRVACLRRGLSADIYVGNYNQFQNELFDASSDLHAFKPEMVLFSFDAHYAFKMEAGNAARTVDTLKKLWEAAGSRLKASVIQQTFLPVFPDLIGNNDHRLPGSPQTFISELNKSILKEGDLAGVAFLAIDKYSARSGLDEWFDPVIWNHGKQEVHPNASLMYGEYAGRLIAAKLGRSSKCMVLDLDNTLWGGIIGDDGLEGIKLGQGSAAGEAFLGFQSYLLEQKKRGIILAVCSKNNEDLALEAFDRHPEMVLRRSDISCFKANWNNKVENLKAISQELNIGLDALLFIDDNPAERGLIRKELPEVAVPELPEDPAYFVDRIAGSGYLESITVTEEDASRSEMYQANAARARLLQDSGDVTGYLEDLNMRLEWGRTDQISKARVAQLLQKTNQFNLTTRRYPENELTEMMEDPSWVLLKARLYDTFGDNGIIAFMALKIDGSKAVIDNWIMSCRVFGRQVEEEMLNIAVSVAQARGASILAGRYLPTPKNAVVQDLYPRLGFSPIEPNRNEGDWILPLSNYSMKTTKIKTSEVS